jgi:tetratricopeptide (TPR) repeat protein
MNVSAWTEKVTIPTYRAGEPEKNPMFLEKRVYQGSSGVVYPHPVIEKISDEKTEQEYNAVFLENEYLKIMILPELGGRIQRAWDKVQQRDFVYYNQVVKPALVGLAGPWISGGIEFNWPQHHRPSTFSPVDFSIAENPDGSKTVWVNETEIMFRTKGMAGFTLYPGKAYLEIQGKLFNPTPFPQTFLWWANPAVKVNDDYQSVFPPDVFAVFDHGKRDVSDFPVATGTYYKVDYAPGTDISRYKNIPVPTSYMAIQSQYDFMGCYEHDTQAGMLHVADHHVSPGKKQWTWGNGDFGFAWDRNLTDEDGPYIELMTGMFTDNQPDFSWLQPNEGKTFEQYFMPYAQIGVVKNASKEAALNLEFANNEVYIKVYATAVYENAAITLLRNGEEVAAFTSTISPAAIFETTVKADDISKPEQWKLVVADRKGSELISWQPESADIEREIPKAATAAKAPADIEQIEDLFLNGLHLEQYRHATFRPEDFYEEGLRRSPEDVRCNNAMGLLLLRRGRFAQAQPYFERAVATLLKRNPNPYDGEPHYNLGLSLFFQQKYQAAYDAFFKATWNDAFQHSAFLFLARIAAHRQKWADALKLVEKSLIRNYHSPAARHLKTALLCKTGRYTEAATLAQESLGIDRFNFGCLLEWNRAEKALGIETGMMLASLRERMRGALQNYQELSLAYAQAGLYAEAADVWTLYPQKGNTVSPLVDYYLGWFAAQSGDQEKALTHYQKAATTNPAFCFPNKIEEVAILQNAMALNPTDGQAHYLLGNLWYDKRQYPEAITAWETAISLAPALPTPYRNLSLAYYNKLGKKQEALALLEKAFALDTTDARVLMELDQLYKILNKPAQERLALLDEHPTLVNDRDDLYLERVTLLNSLFRYEEAKALLAARKFHPWEGGEGKVLGQFLLCHIELAKQAIEVQDFEDALALLNATRVYPENLGEGKIYGTQENDIDYLTALAHAGLQQEEQAMVYFKKATVGTSEPVQAIYYNDQQPDKIFYQGLAWLKLNAAPQARAIFERFVAFGDAHLDDQIRIDYFAVSLPDMLVFDADLNLRNRVHCLYLKGLGHLGLGEYETARALLEEVAALNANHQAAAAYLRMWAFFESLTGVLVSY